MKAITISMRQGLEKRDNTVTPLFIEPHVLKFEGEWHVRPIGGYKWEISPEGAPAFPVLYKKKGKFYVYRYMGREYSYRYEVTQEVREEVKPVTTRNIRKESGVSLFDDIHSFPDKEEALRIAYWYQERERNQSIVYLDPVKGRGILTVSSIGIIDHTATLHDLGVVAEKKHRA